MLYLLTATGARPVAWALCQRFMLAQTYAGRVTWVIVDDGPEPQIIQFRRDGWTLQVIRPEPPWAPGNNTQARNLRAGLALVPDDARLLIIEDDDYYAPDWLEYVAGYLQGAPLVGEARTKYYNVAIRRARQMNNKAHSSLCATGLQGAGLARFRALCGTAPKFIDILLWRGFRGGVLLDSSKVIGIKGLPGRPGIGVGHKKDFHGNEDGDGRILRQWIGQDAELYLGT